jgi:hypothetical protein
MKKCVFLGGNAVENSLGFSHEKCVFLGENARNKKRQFHGDFAINFGKTNGCMKLS